MTGREEKTWDELAKEAYNGHTSQGAAVEALRRVAGALVASEKSANALGGRIWWLNFWLLVVTVAIAVLTLVMAWPTMAVWFPKGSGR